MIDFTHTHTEFEMLLFSRNWNQYACFQLLWSFWVDAAEKFGLNHTIVTLRENPCILFSFFSHAAKLHNFLMFGIGSVKKNDTPKKCVKNTQEIDGYLIVII